MTDVIDIAAVDDHPIILDSVAGWVRAGEGDIQVVATAATVDALLAGPGRYADVVLLDLDLGDGTTPEGNVAAICAAGPAVLVLSASDRPPAVRAAIQAGARGYALKNEPAERIRSAIKEVAAGRDWISPRLAFIFATDDAADRPALSKQERRVLQLYATGLPLKSVARKMGISEETVKQYLGRVRHKYTLAGRAAPTKLELYRRAVEDGHLSPPSLTSHPPTVKEPGNARPRHLRTSLKLLLAGPTVMTPLRGSPYRTALTSVITVLPTELNSSGRGCRPSHVVTAGLAHPDFRHRGGTMLLESEA